LLIPYRRNHVNIVKRLHDIVLKDLVKQQQTRFVLGMENLTLSKGPSARQNFVPEGIDTACY
jgi:hypothetical protein